jgi:hypothetical protein
MVTADTIPIRSKDVLIRRDGGGVLLFQTRTDEMYYVSDGVHEVLKLCDGARTIGEISDLFAGKGPESSCPDRREPVEHLIEELTTRGVVELWR